MRCDGAQIECIQEFDKFFVFFLAFFVFSLAHIETFLSSQTKLLICIFWCFTLRILGLWVIVFLMVAGVIILNSKCYPSRKYLENSFFSNICHLKLNEKSEKSYACQHRRFFDAFLQADVEITTTSLSIEKIQKITFLIIF